VVHPIFFEKIVHRSKMVENHWFTANSVKYFKVPASAPSKKILHWANVCFIAHEAHAAAQPCRLTNSEAFPTLKGLCDMYIPRGVTRLGGVRGKKQVWRPHVRTWGLSEANVLKKVFATLVGLFGTPRSDSAFP